MQKLMMGSLLLVLLGTLSAKVFANEFDCKFSDSSIKGVQSIKISEDYLIINKNLEIPLDKSRVKCGHLGRQTRFDGNALGYLVILKSCSLIAKFEGHLIDERNNVSADVLCQPSKKI